MLANVRVHSMWNSAEEPSTPTAWQSEPDLRLHRNQSPLDEALQRDCKGSCLCQQGDAAVNVAIGLDCTTTVCWFGGVHFKLVVVFVGIQSAYRL